MHFILTHTHTDSSISVSLKHSDIWIYDVIHLLHISVNRTHTHTTYLFHWKLLTQSFSRRNIRIYCVYYDGGSEKKLKFSSYVLKCIKVHTKVMVKNGLVVVVCVCVVLVVEWDWMISSIWFKRGFCWNVLYIAWITSTKQEKEKINQNRF